MSRTTALAIASEISSNSEPMIETVNPAIDSNENRINTSSKNSSDDIEFKVQIAVSGKPIPLNSDFFKKMNDVYEFKENNLYKYAVGSKETYNEIVEYSKWVKNKFPDAFIIAFKKGKVISMEQALKETVINNN